MREKDKGNDSREGSENTKREKERHGPAGKPTTGQRGQGQDDHAKSALHVPLVIAQKTVLFSDAALFYFYLNQGWGKKKINLISKSMIDALRS